MTDFAATEVDSEGAGPGAHGSPQQGIVIDSVVIAGLYGVDAVPPVAPPDLTAPVLSNVNPSAGSVLSKFQILSANITDNSGIFARIMVAIEFNDGITELVHDGATFVGPYLGTSSRTIIVGGYHFDILRNGGWPDNRRVKRLRYFMIDAAGNDGG